MGRRAVLEGVDHATKALAHFGLVITGQLERLDHGIKLVVPNRPGNKLVTVTAQVILVSQNLKRITIERRAPALRHRERVVAKVDLAAFLIGLVHREIDDPSKGKPVLIGQAKLVTNHRARLAGNPLEDRRLAAKEKRRVALAKAKLKADRLGAFGADVLGQGACGLDTVFAVAPEDIAHAGQTLFLRECVHPVTELAAPAGGRGNGANFGALLLQQLGEDRKARAAEMLGDILHLDRVAQVGLVGAIPKRRVAIRDMRPMGINRRALTELLENALYDRLDRVEDILLRDKGHLKVKLIEISRRTVGARVFVAKTRRDLEILVKAADHDQLFELLRRLRQGVELAGMLARRHQKVARAFGRRGGDDRRLVFAKTLVPHAAAH